MLDDADDDVVARMAAQCFTLPLSAATLM